MDHRSVDEVKEMTMALKNIQSNTFESDLEGAQTVSSEDTVNLWSSLKSRIGQSGLSTGFVTGGDQRAANTLDSSPAQEVDSSISSPTPSDRKVQTYIVSLTPLQEWDGYVLSFDSDSLRVRLTDVTNEWAQDSEEAEIPISELQESDAEELQVGQLFRWSIGYERSRNGQKTRISRIVMRRLPSWQQNELKKAKTAASEMLKSFSQD